MSPLEPGISRSDDLTVADRLLTDVGGTIGASVLSTPGMIAMMERNRGCSVMSRRHVLAVVLGGAALAAPAIGVAATANPDYTKMIVVSGKKSSQATLGTRCHPNPDGGASSCVETTYPLKTTGKVTLRAGDRLTLLLGAAATDVRWRGARIDGAGKEQLVIVGAAVPITKTQKRWRIQLPKRMSARTKLLGFDVAYKNAYSSFEVGAKVARTRAR